MTYDPMVARRGLLLTTLALIDGRLTTAPHAAGTISRSIETSQLPDNSTCPITSSSARRTTARASVINYGSFPPLTLPATSGACSPLGWPITFYDDFSGLSVNTSTQIATTTATGSNGYSMFIGGASGSNQSVANPHNVKLVGGILQLQGTNVSLDGGAHPFSSAGLWTRPFHSKRWGYWECLTQLPNGANGSQHGLWGSFWISARTDANWPQEVDGIEQNVSAGNKHAQNSTTHYGASNTTAGGSFQGMALPNGGSTITDFHLYGILVTPNYIAFYCDHQLQQSTSGITSPLNPTGTKYAVAAKGRNGFTGLDGVVGQGPGDAPTNPMRHHFGFDTMWTNIAFCVGSTESGTSATAASFPCAQQVKFWRHSLLGPE
jgi:beta-glucanase (GH16 family)